MSPKLKSWLQIAGAVLLLIFVGAPVIVGVDNGLRAAGVYKLIEAAVYGCMALVAAFCGWYLVVRPILERLGVRRLPRFHPRQVSLRDPHTIGQPLLVEVLVLPPLADERPSFLHSFHGRD